MLDSVAYAAVFSRRSVDSVDGDSTSTIRLASVS